MPLRHAEALSLPTIGEMLVGGLGGSVEVLSVYAVVLGVHTLQPRLLEIAAHPDEAWILLGRDVMNDYLMSLNGPRLALEIG